MGSIYRRKEFYCKTCKAGGGKRLARTADRKACQAAGHDIDERPSGVYWVKYSRDGKSYAESSESELKGKAKLLLQRLEGDIARGKPITPKIGRFTFDEAAKDLLADYRINGQRSHAVVERRIRKHLTPFFGGWRMADISPTEVRAYILHRQTDLSVLVRKAHAASASDGTKCEIPEVRRPASNAEINRELALLKRMFSLAAYSGPS